jgi:flavorubredoxin
MLKEESLVYEPAQRYFAEIMMPFRKIIQKNIGKIDNLAIKYIAPSHGPIYPRPQYIIDAYRQWIVDKPGNQVVIAHVTMHNSTLKMVDYLIEALAARDIEVRPFNLAVADLGKLAMSLVEAATIIVGSPTVLTGLHPLAAEAVFLVNALRPKARWAGFVGSYGWKSRAVDQLKAMLDSVQFELLTPVQIKGYPGIEELSLLDKLAEEILQKHKTAGLI